MKIFWMAASLVFVGFFARGASSATLSGTITGNDGKPIAGAMVTLRDETRGLAESVFSDAKGAFRITTGLSGDLSLRIRKFYFADLDRPFSLPPDAAVKGDFILNRLVSAEAISEDLPAAYHFGQIPFEPGTAFARDRFQKACAGCHQLGNVFTRWPRSMEDWTTIARRMNAKIGSTDEALIKKRAELLAAGFNGKPISVRPNFPYDPALARARIVEYRLDQSNGAHDAAVSPDDGLIYMVDGGTQKMVVTDPKAGTTEYFPAPQDGRDPSKKSAQPDKGSAESGDDLGLHSLAIGKDGRWYVTEAGINRIGVFNPKTRAWEKAYELPGKSHYPHTIRVDKAGIVWFTIALSNQIGSLDPATGKVTVIELPVTTKSYAEGPYGIAVDPKDGAVWYAKLGSERIGRIDNRTFEVKEWTSPMEGPRRMQFDASGRLWVTGYSKGEIMRIEPNGPKDFKSEVIEMPKFDNNDGTAPYSLGIHPKTGDVWVNDTATDHIYRYIPAEKRWIAYPEPLKGAFTRDLSFTKEGYVCMSTDAAPLAAMEGGVAELFCIHPEGDVKVEARAD